MILKIMYIPFLLFGKLFDVSCSLSGYLQRQPVRLILKMTCNTLLAIKLVLAWRVLRKLPFPKLR